MAVLTTQIRAILWAQWRSLLNHGIRRHSGSLLLSATFSILWYGMWVFAAWGIAVITASSENLELIIRTMPAGLLVMCLYWQVVPVLTAGSGVSLDLQRLLVYPVPYRDLFAIETLLRLTSAIEMLLLAAGLSIGLLLNPAIPFYSVIGVFVFCLFNLLLSAGLRDLFVRLMARKGLRELGIFFLVLAAAAPQAILLSDVARGWRGPFESGFGSFWPWSATAAVASGRDLSQSAFFLLLWTALAGWFARRQFEKNLRTDSSALRSVGKSADRLTLADRLFRIPDHVLPDPLAVVVGKELRFLSRAPRFRLLFLMGFSFGLLVWLPLALRSGNSSPLRGNYLTIISAYALMLLGEVLFWNMFGMDRAAAQTWFVTPVPFPTILKAKNIAAACFIFLEVTIVAIFCIALRLPVAVSDLAESFAVTSVLALLMMSMGNVISVRFPRAVDPKQSWRGSRGSAQAFLLVIYPLASLPVILAYGARYAFNSDLAFWAVIALDLVLSAIVYSIALESASASGWKRREEIVAALSNAESPVAG